MLRTLVSIKPSNDNTLTYWIETNTCVTGTEWEPVDSQEREAGVAVQAEREHPALPGQDLSHRE